MDDENALLLTSTTTASSDAAATSAKPRGPGHTNVEDVIVARAFIAASENAISGNHQKGRVFKDHMHDIYVDFIKEHVAADKKLLMQSSHATREEYVRKGVGRLFPKRSADSIYTRFKSQIAAEVMKFMGIVETTKMCSGWNADDHKAACLELYKQRYGHPFDFYTSYEYLKDMNKFASYRTKIDEEQRGDESKRPLGKKKSRQAEADAKIVKAVVSEVFIKQESGGATSVLTNNEGSGNGGGIGDIMQNISEVIANVGTAMLENMKAEQDMRLIQSPTLLIGRHSLRNNWL
ncbi:hypothetical protein MHU86_13318 [Fragilaria crotonensis]|nr:hypothetical protein MHU86_13318 [Fragilaria crotonensis]